MDATKPPLPQNYLKNLEKMRSDIATADFVIASGVDEEVDEHKVHRHVLNLHSEYFARLFNNGDYKENSQNRIELVDDPKIAVKCMIQFFYKFDYEFERGDFAHHTDYNCSASRVLDTLATRDPSQLPNDPIFSRLQGHANVYTLADKYDIPDLKTLAKQKFESLAQELTCSETNPKALREFLLVVPYVYSHTAPNEKGLRTSVVSAWRLAPDKISETLGQNTLGELLENYQDLALDLITGLVDSDEAGGRRVRRKYEPAGGFGPSRRDSSNPPLFSDAPTYDTKFYCRRGAGSGFDSPGPPPLRPVVAASNRQTRQSAGRRPPPPTIDLTLDSTGGSGAPTTSARRPLARYPSLSDVQLAGSNRFFARP